MRTSSEEYKSALKNLQDGTIKKITQLPSDEPRFIIDSNSREITIPDEFTFLGVKNDANAETIYFEIDRYFDAEDFANHTIVVQYTDKSDLADDMAIGVEPITDIDITSVPGKIIFGWTISHEVTFNAATIAFAVRIYTIGEDKHFIYSFNTLANELPILDTLDVTKETIKRYSNILDVWLAQMEELKIAVDTKIEAIQNLSMGASFDKSTGNLIIKTITDGK